eukprot:SAG11_NODE_8461_length_1012_cov_2.036145_1_plen_229_part_10
MLPSAIVSTAEALCVQSPHAPAASLGANSLGANSLGANARVRSRLLQFGLALVRHADRDCSCFGLALHVDLALRNGRKGRALAVQLLASALRLQQSVALPDDRALSTGGSRSLVGSLPLGIPTPTPSADGENGGAQAKGGGAEGGGSSHETDSSQSDGGLSANGWSAGGSWRSVPPLPIAAQRGAENCWSAAELDRLLRRVAQCCTEAAYRGVGRRGCSGPGLGDLWLA